jgi:hypothetical protein
LPNVVSPTITARSWSCSAPATISEALALFSFTSTATAHAEQTGLGLEKQRCRLERSGKDAARIVPQIQHQALERAAAQALHGGFDLRARIRIEARDPHISDPGLEQEGALDARGLHFRRRKRELENADIPGLAHLQPRLLLARLAQQLDDLLDLEPP